MGVKTMETYEPFLSLDNCFLRKETRQNEFARSIEIGRVALKETIVQARPETNREIHISLEQAQCVINSLLGTGNCIRTDGMFEIQPLISTLFKPIQPVLKLSAADSFPN